MVSLGRGPGDFPAIKSDELLAQKFERDKDKDYPQEPQELKVEDQTSWRELFDQWKMVFADNFNHKTTIEDVRSDSECQIKLVFSSEIIVEIEQIELASFHGDENEVIIFVDDGNHVINGLTNPGKIVSASRTLQEFCKNI